MVLFIGGQMIRYPQDMVELRYLKVKPNNPWHKPEAKLQYRIKNISIVDYTETWSDWRDVPTVDLADEDDD